MLHVVVAKVGAYDCFRELKTRSILYKRACTGAQLGLAGLVLFGLAAALLKKGPPDFPDGTHLHPSVSSRCAGTKLMSQLTHPDPLRPYV